MRNPTACKACRRAKRRCIWHKASETCTSCQKRQLVCEGKLQTRVVGHHRHLIPDPRSITATGRAVNNTVVAVTDVASRHASRRHEHVPENECQRQSQHPVSHGPSPKPTSRPRLGPPALLSLSHGTAIELVEHYLDKFDGRPHSIFHPATLRSQVRSGTLNEVVLYAICAIGCKFSANPDTRAQGPHLAAESKRLLQADLSNICLENIQAGILVAMLSVGHGETAAEALFFRIATAMAEIMGLNSPDSGARTSAIDREIRHRVWWSLYMTDLWCMCGQGLHSQLKDIEAKIELPISDSTFITLRPEQCSIPATTHPGERGIFTHLVTLVPLFAPIHNINRLIAEGEPHSVELDQQVERLAWELEDWKHKLQPDAQMSEENLRRQQKLGLGGLLLSLHLAYHHYCILLYFRYLEGSGGGGGGQRPPYSTSNSTPSLDHHTTTKYIARCKSHASSFSSLLLLSRQLKGCDVVYPNIGHMATVSSSVLVHTLLFGDDLDELEAVSRELNANFEALIELTQYWPATSAMIERLIVFQDMCLLSTESSATHKLDGWMLRFLTEHSLDIEAEAKILQVGGSIIHPQRGLNADLEKMMLSSRAKELAVQGRYLNFRPP